MWLSHISGHELYIEILKYRIVVITNLRFNNIVVMWNLVDHTSIFLIDFYSLKKQSPFFVKFYFVHILE